MEYNVKYWPVESEMKPIIEAKVTSLTIKAPMTSAKLTGLKLFTKYAVKVAAVTQTGIGAYTDAHYGGAFYVVIYRCISTCIKS